MFSTKKLRKLMDEVAVLHNPIIANMLIEIANLKIKSDKHEVDIGKLKDKDIMLEDKKLDKS